MPLGSSKNSWRRAEEQCEPAEKAEENERKGRVGGRNFFLKVKWAGGMEAGFPGGASREPEMSSRDPGFAE
jgi:hypothetical protein